jgi:hypothetical protein
MNTKSVLFAALVGAIVALFLEFIVSTLVHAGSVKTCWNCGASRFRADDC